MRRIKLVVLFLMSIFLFVLGGCKNLETKEEVVRIGISWTKNYKVGEEPKNAMPYMAAVKKAGAIPVLLPQIENEAEAQEVLKTIDAVILTGGEDVNPGYYSEQPHPNLEAVNVARDTSDYWLIKVAVEKDYPYLGICRGMQFLNIMRGGTLYQDLPTEYNLEVEHRDPKKKNFAYHDIKITDKDSFIYEILGREEIKVNSWHHQAAEKIGKGLKVTAVSPEGVTEAVELEGKTFVMGVQFHPERLVESEEKEFLPFFVRLKEEGLKNRKRVK